MFRFVYPFPTCSNYLLRVFFLAHNTEHLLRTISICFKLVSHNLHVYWLSFNAEPWSPSPYSFWFASVCLWMTSRVHVTVAMLITRLSTVEGTLLSRWRLVQWQRQMTISSMMSNLALNTGTCLFDLLCVCLCAHGCAVCVTKSNRQTV